MITYRPVPPEDIEQLCRNDALAFGHSPTVLRDYLATAPELEARALYRDGQIIAQVLLYPQQLAAGYGDLPVFGMGSLAVPPAQRRRGYADRLLRAACDELAERGCALTLLSPMNAAFYHKLGWATAGERRYYYGAPALLRHYIRPAGRWDAVGPDDFDTLAAIYHGALRGRFGPIIRSEQWWRTEVWAADTYGFVWRDDAGSARASVLYQLQQRDGQRLLRCREAYALDPTARGQLLGLLAQHAGQCDVVQLRTPIDPPVNLLQPNPLRCEIEQLWMLRITDVAQLLAMYPFPANAAGTLSIAVRDGWLLHNEDGFTLEVADGSAQVQRSTDPAAADLACSGAVLAQIISRAIPPRSAAAFGALEVRNKAALATAQEIFAGLPPFSSDWF